VNAAAAGGTRSRHAEPRCADPTTEATRRLAQRLLTHLASDATSQRDAVRTCSVVKARSVLRAPDHGWIGSDWASDL